MNLPYPTTPTNGQTGNATPILTNLVALQQAISAFDGSQINSKSVVEAALADSINPQLRDSEIIQNFVHTGCIWTTVSGLSVTMTGGTIYVNGYRTLVNAVGSYTLTASKDTYIDIDYLGNITYNAVNNNATAPALTANSLRVAKIVTGGASVTSITQTGSDGIGNIIYPLYSQNPYKFSVYLNGAQNSTNGTSTVLLDTATFDTGSNFSTSNHYFTAPISGFYHLDFGVGAGVSPSGIWQSDLYKVNTTTTILYGNYFSGVQYSVSGGSGLLQLTAGDEIALRIQASGAYALETGASFTYLHCFLLSLT